MDRKGYEGEERRGGERKGRLGGVEEPIRILTTIRVMSAAVLLTTSGI